MRLEVERDEATCHTPAFWSVVDPYDITDPVQRAAYEQRMTTYPADPGNAGIGQGWARPEFDDGTWPAMTLPTSWQNAGHAYSGVVWFRRVVDVPAAWAGRDLQLGIGAVDKQDITYFNGEQVGATGTGFQREFWSLPRKYTVPGRLVKAGRNVVAVRAYSFLNHGGLIGPADQMSLAPAAGGGAVLRLSGDWRFAVEHNFGRVTAATQLPGPGNPDTAGILFDNLIAPVIPYGIRGVLWYQGESNADAFCAPRYGGMLARLVRDWRHAWGQGDFAFLTVQLANYLAPQWYQEASGWARVREGQQRSLELPETGVAVAIDIGDAADIHPRNKREVGRRLAQWALTRTHHAAGVPCGPLFAGASIEPRGIRVRFQHVGGGLRTKGGVLRTFALAGSSHVFVPAEAVIEGDTVLVSSPQVAQPVAVRYAWADNPDGANLCNVEGFPAFPFRSDAW